MKTVQFPTSIGPSKAETDFWTLISKSSYDVSKLTHGRFVVERLCQVGNDFFLVEENTMYSNLSLGPFLGSYSQVALYSGSYKY